MTIGIDVTRATVATIAITNDAVDPSLFTYSFCCTLLPQRRDIIGIDKTKELSKDGYEWYDGYGYDDDMVNIEVGLIDLCNSDIIWFGWYMIKENYIIYSHFLSVCSRIHFECDSQTIQNDCDNRIIIEDKLVDQRRKLL